MQYIVQAKAEIRLEKSTRMSLKYQNTVQTCDS